MKTALLLLLIASAAHGQMKCTALTGLTAAPRIHEACTFPDGSGLELETIADTFHQTEYSAEDWPARYASLIKADTEALKAVADIHAGYQKSYKLSTKKACTAAGEPYYWKDHVCNVRVH